MDLSRPYGARYDGVGYLAAGDNSQGLYFLQALKALEAVRLDRGPVDPLGRDAGMVATVLACAAADRDRYGADPQWSPAPAEELLSDSYVRRIADQAMAGTPVELLGQRKASGDTVAMVAADAQGTWSLPDPERLPLLRCRAARPPHRHRAGPSIYEEAM
ncbi:gamma-glutamyltransferase [Streptomyces scopuliridis]|uniref:gamma-glutamyltransferase n=1 Tax=Streptomyces scopuliridis TaxID=452529 RepID=UPI0035DF8946